MTSIASKAVKECHFDLCSFLSPFILILTAFLFIQTTTEFNVPTTPNWIVEETNRTGWVMYVGVGEKPSLMRPETYITCDLPHLNDPIRVSYK